MRLLHVIHTLDVREGGAVNVAQAMCAALADRGHDVTLLATGHQARRERRKGYEVRTFPTQFAPMAVSWGLQNALADFTDADLIHIHQLYRYPQAVTAAFARRRNIPYCVQPHGALAPVLFHKAERRGAKRLYERLVEMPNLRAAAGLVFTAEGEKDAAAFLNLPAPEFVVPNGVDLGAAAEARPGEFRTAFDLKDKLLIAWMGRLVPVKALDILCRAFVRLAADDAVLVLAGPDPDGYGHDLKMLAQELGCAPDRILFTGMLQGAQKWALLKDADLFVLPSHTENFGLAAVEAMSVGRPVIVTPGVKIAADIVKADAGMLVQQDPVQLAAAMDGLLSNAARRADLSTKAAEFARRFAWPAVARQLEDAYRIMIGNGR